jgi:hypothetical protein
MSESGREKSTAGPKKIAVSRHSNAALTYIESIDLGP